jgi:A/G-specific adenine glycosylase
MDFADKLLAWYEKHGRHDLPWQVRGDPYPVWIAEIMLQQTQVGTVIPYYERFLLRFPDIRSLAAAELDQVLHHWSGLGYYARARNLHRAARQIVDRHNAMFPRRFDDVLALPGIGRSTAGAILAQSFGQRHAILDGNVKRVLSRYFRIDGWPGHSATQHRLWEASETVTPQQRVADYTQAIMDLGATVCSRGRPACLLCPLNDDCAAHRHGEETAFPNRRTGRPLPLRAATLLLLRDEQQRICLVQRPPTGIWGGLWSLPEMTGQAPEAWAAAQLGMSISTDAARPPLRHSFTHFHLDLHVIPAVVTGMSGLRSMEQPEVVWYNADDATELGMAAPIRQIISQ